MVSKTLIYWWYDVKQFSCAEVIYLWWNDTEQVKLALVCKKFQMNINLEMCYCVGF
jgi:hypothetical protein